MSAAPVEFSPSVGSDRTAFYITQSRRRVFLTGDTALAARPFVVRSEGAAASYSRIPVPEASDLAEGLAETLDILGDSEMMSAIEAGVRAFDNGDVVEREDLLRLLAERSD